jgi:hypothetical protein
MAYERKTVDILISDDLRDILLEIESESIVAHKLLKKRHKKEDIVDDNVNYISISKTDKTRVSYVSKDRLETIPTEEYWTSSKRYNAKPGAFVSKVFKNISQPEVEKFSNLFRAESIKPKFKFDVVSGKEIKKYYRYDSYAEDGRGSLGISCMKHDGCQKLLDIYVVNKEVSMVVMLNEENYLLGRAILWNFDGNKIMDRIYTHDDEKLQHHFKKWATANGYLYKSEQNWFNTLFFENMKSDKKELKLEIKINADLKYLPYMDTFKFIGSNGHLYNYHPNEVNFKTLCACDGGRYDQDYLKFDSIDRVFRYRGEAPYLQYLDIFTHERNLNYSSVNDCYILRKDAKYDENLDDYIFNDEYDSFNNKERIEERLRYLEEKRKYREERIKAKDLENIPTFDVSFYDNINNILSMRSRSRISENFEPNQEEPNQEPNQQPLGA